MKILKVKVEQMQVKRHSKQATLRSKLLIVIIFIILTKSGCFFMYFVSGLYKNINNVIETVSQC